MLGRRVKLVDPRWFLGLGGSDVEALQRATAACSAACTILLSRMYNLQAVRIKHFLKQRLALHAINCGSCMFACSALLVLARQNSALPT